MFRSGKARDGLDKKVKELEAEIRILRNEMSIN